MQKSLFKKYLFVTMAVVLGSFIIIGSVMMTFFGQYWRDEKRGLLTKNAKAIAAMAQNSIHSDSVGNHVIDTVGLKFSLYNFASNIDADIFVTDISGNVLVGKCENSGIDVLKIDEELVGRTLSGTYETEGTLMGVYPSNFYSIGVPVFEPGSLGGGGIFGAVYVSTSAETIGEFQFVMLRIFLIGAVAAFLIAFCVLWFFTLRLVKPLRQMAVAAKSFGSGDFSVRVPVASQDEIGQLAAAFNNMANSLTNSEGMRRSFVANVSHELKTPMTTIAGFIDGILDGTIPKEEQGKYLRVVSEEVKRLSRLVKSMLDLSKIDNGEMKLNPVKFDLTETIFTTLLTFEKLINDKNIEVKGLEEMSMQYVVGDQDLIHQVLYNLVENAVKFTNNGGYIRITLADSIDRTSVLIENSGAGIDRDDLPMIFDRFYKTDKSRSQDKNGMGLGLYLVRMIIKLHGGEITVYSVPEQKTGFEFYIPKNNEQLKSQAQQKHSRETKKERRTGKGSDGLNVKKD